MKATKLEAIWFGIKSTSVIALVLGCFVIVTPLAYKAMKLFEHKEKVYNEQLVKLSSNVASKRIEFNNKLLQAQITSLNKQIVDLAKHRKEDIKAVGEIVTSLKQDLKEQIGHNYKDTKDSSKDYYETVIKKNLSDKSEIPWAWAMYSPNIKGDNKWTTGSYPIKIHTKIAIGKKKDRSDAMVEAYMTSNIFKKDKGKHFPLDISDVTWIEAPPKAKSFRFNPRLSIGMSLSSDLYPSLEVSFFSYGKTKGDMDWRFIGVGFGADKDNRYLYLAPVEYNIGKPLPLMDNLFFSPFVGMDQSSGMVWGAQLQLPL